MKFALLAFIPILILNNSNVSICRRSVSAPVPKKISVAITPVSSASPGEPPTAVLTPKLPPNLPDLTPITTPKQETAPFIKQVSGGVHTQYSREGRLLLL